MGAGSATVVVGLLRLVVVWWQARSGACPECGRYYRDLNLSALERVVRLSEKTGQHVDVTYRPNMELPWCVLSRAWRVEGDNPAYELFVGRTFDAAMAQAEMASEPVFAAESSGLRLRRMREPDRRAS